MGANSSVSQTRAKSAFSFGFLLADVLGDRFAADFFFAFENDLDVDRQLAAVALHQRFERLDFHPELALVVDRAAGIDVVVALGGLKRRRMPLVHRVGRLHIVVRVHQHGGLAGCMQPVGVEQGMALGGNDLDILHADAAQFVGDKFRRLLHIALVLVQRADAGDAKEVLQFIQETRLIIAGKIDCWGSHSLLPFWRAGRACEETV